jgi:hypothetical protein
MTQEAMRLQQAQERTAHWRRWGPYLSERQWGTVREDYSPSGTAWDFFPHDHARSRAYRWGEDGLAGICDNHQRLCFALALWNGQDPILKERLFGLTGSEGNHGEDVKEYYFYLDSTPTHSYMKYLSRRANPTMFQKTLSLNDFYFGAQDCAYPLGNIQMIGKSQGVMFRGEAPRLIPGMTLDQMAKHAVDFWLTTEDLPDPNNRITVNALGQIQLQYTFNNQVPTRRLEAKLHAMLEHLGCHKHLIPNNLYLGKHIPIAGVGHQAGTCRFGTDAATSVLNVNCKAHELDNLYVVDTSFFPSTGTVNPSLTAMANALRVGDHIRERLG